MATLTPPTEAFRLVDRYHFIRFGYTRTTACGDFVWEDIPNDVFKNVSDLNPGDICEICLGAMEATDSQPTWGSMEREGGTWEGKMEFMPPVCCPRCGSTDTPWDFTYTLHPQPCRRCGDCDWVWDPEEAMTKKIQSEKEASENDNHSDVPHGA